jgi:hypothetical protein
MKIMGSERIFQNDIIIDFNFEDNDTYIYEEYERERKDHGNDGCHIVLMMTLP